MIREREKCEKDLANLISSLSPGKMRVAQVICTLLACWMVLVTYYMFHEQPPSDFHACEAMGLPPKNRLLSPDLFDDLDRISKPEVIAKCIDSRLLHIGGLEKQINQWRMSKHKLCNDLFNLFNVILRVESRTGHLNVTATFRAKLMKWFGGNEDLVSQAKTQTVIFVTNKWTFDATVFNPIREKRPIVRPNVTDSEYVQELAEKTAKSCDFCNYQSATSPDFYGRIETPRSFTASNAFKLDAWHALVIFREHHPTKWTEEALLDVFSTAMKWFANVNQHNPDFIYPFIFWDLLPHASASQVHPHIHVALTNTGYWGLQEEWRQVGKQYNAKLSGRDYFRDLTAIHDILGLTAKHGSASAFASLTPKKDHEVVITSSSANKDFFQMIYYVTRAFIDDLGKKCFSMSIALPPLKPVGDNFNMPAMVRVVTRGTASEVRSDVSSMELFAASNVNIDPFNVAKAIQGSLAKRSLKR